MIRFILEIPILIMVGIISIVFYPFELLLKKINISAHRKSSMKFIQGLFKVFLFIAGTKVTINGREKILSDRPVLYVANHRSIFDIIITYTYMLRPTGYVAKDNLAKIPVLAQWMKAISCLFLNRSDTREGLKTILKGIDYIKDGVSIFIFPEGKRNHSDLDMIPFKEGSFKLATKTGCPIIPVAINNTSAIFEDQYPKLRKASVTITFHDPIYLDDMTKEEMKHLAVTTHDIIYKTVSENAKIN